jgi:glycosyltransferase involved in cell wall biosynthesis
VTAKKICFISHNATRTGAPLVLLHFVKWVKQFHPEIEFEVWLMSDGELKTEFEKLSSVKVIPSKYESSILKRTLSKVFGYSSQRKFLVEVKNFDLLFFNTAASLVLLQGLPGINNTQKVLWIHEQPFSIFNWYSENFNSQNLNKFDLIFSVSTKTIKLLKDEFKIPQTRLQYMPPTMHIETSVRQKKIIENSEFVIGGCGLQEWRKGPDLFVQVAKVFKETYLNAKVRFVWVGGEGGFTNQLNYEAELLGMVDSVEFVGEVANPSEYFSTFDIFLLTSREDPFPLVVLEAIAETTPVLGFEGVGNIENVINVISENLIEYLDVSAVAHRIWYYYNNEIHRLNHGQLLHENLQKIKLDYSEEKFFAGIMDLFK